MLFERRPYPRRVEPVSMPPHDESAPTKTIVVLGAGLAGLAASYECLKIGYRVVLLESQGRVGGRVLTYRGFGNGMHVELGAMRIPDVHKIVLHYINELGVGPVREFKNSSDGAIKYLLDRPDLGDVWRTRNSELWANPRLIRQAYPGLANDEDWFDPLWSKYMGQIATNLFRYHPIDIDPNLL